LNIGFLMAEASKSGKKRIVPINETLRMELDRLGKLNKAKSGFVFLYEDPKSGKMRNVKTVRKAFVMACRRAGIMNLRFHDLRHAAGTRLIKSGADPISVRDILGHADLKTTEGYLHSSLKRMEAAARLLDKPQAKDLPEVSPECHQKSSKPEDWKPSLFLSMN
jgi:integrase